MDDLQKPSPLAPLPKGEGTVSLHFNCHVGPTTDSCFALVPLAHEPCRGVRRGRGTAVLTGALLVGDSMRGSLRHLTLDRLAASMKRW